MASGSSVGGSSSSNGVDDAETSVVNAKYPTHHPGKATNGAVFYLIFSHAI
jgi:hypothetical protein